MLIVRGTITGVATIVGGLCAYTAVPAQQLSMALKVAYGVVTFELLAIAFIRYRYMKTPLLNTVVQVIIGGGIVFAVGIWLGSLGGAS